MDRTKALTLIVKERNSQLERWGDVHHSHIEYISLLAEELGEASRHAHEIHWNGKYYNIDVDEKKRMLAEELSQLAALCLAALESI